LSGIGIIVMRGIFVFLGDIEGNSGAVTLMQSYAKAYRQAGVSLDLYYLLKTRNYPYGERVESSLFDRIYTPANRNPNAHEIDAKIRARFSDEFLPEMGVDPIRLYSAAKIVESGQYDFVGVHYTACHHIVDMLPADITKVLYTHDLDSVVRQQKGNLIFGGDAFPVTEEIRRLKKFDLVTVVGSDDQKFVLDQDPALRPIVATYCPEVALKVEIREKLENLLFVGSNVPFKQLSLQWFWRFVWPVMDKFGFDGFLNIVGGISNYAVEIGMHKDPRCRIHGVVDSVNPYLMNADLLLSPYYYGAGIKTNIIDAIACGLPVITTQYGLSNTLFKGGHDILVSNNAVEFAQLIHEASSYVVRKQLSENGLDTVRLQHSADSALQEMVTQTRALVDQFIEKSRVNINAGYLSVEIEERLPPILSGMVKAGHKRIAIYGAGSHTQALLGVWNRLTDLQIDCVVVSEKNSPSFRGVPVVSIEEIGSRSVDAILASSKSFELSMASYSQQYAPNIPFYAIWNTRLGVKKSQIMGDELTDDNEDCIKADIP
jgi:glycosyltransferase involved in cell wall biosynthesis